MRAQSHVVGVALLLGVAVVAQYPGDRQAYLVVHDLSLEVGDG